MLVDCFTLSDQSIDGAAAVAQNLAQRYQRPQHPDPAGADAHRRGREGQGGRRAGGWRRRVRRPPGRADARTTRTTTGPRCEIPYRPFYAYEETLATFGDDPGLAASLLGRLRAAHRRDHRRADPRCRRDERGDPAARQGRVHCAAGRRRPAMSTSATRPRTGCGRTGSRPCSRRGRHPRRAARDRVGRGRQHPRGRGAGRGNGQPHDRRAVGRLYAVTAGQGRLGRDAGPPTRPATSRRLIPITGGRDPARAAVL